MVYYGNHDFKIASLHRALNGRGIGKSSFQQTPGMGKSSTPRNKPSKRRTKQTEKKIKKQTKNKKPKKRKAVEEKQKKNEVKKIYYFFNIFTLNTNIERKKNQNYSSNKKKLFPILQRKTIGLPSVS